MTLTVWLSFVVVCILGTISPGPSLAVVLRQTLSNGRTHGLLTAISHSCGVALWALLTLWGLGVLIAEHPLLYQLITYTGACYLAWLGYKALRSTGAAPLQSQGAQGSYLKAVMDGAMISLLNPKLAIFFIALFSQFVSGEQNSSEHWLMMLTVTVIDLCWFCGMAVVLSQARVVAAIQRKAKTVDQLSGVVMIGLALRVAAF